MFEVLLKNKIDSSKNICKVLLEYPIDNKLMKKFLNSLF